MDDYFNNHEKDDTLNTDANAADVHNDNEPNGTEAQPATDFGNSQINYGSAPDSAQFDNEASDNRYGTSPSGSAGSYTSPYGSPNQNPNQYGTAPNNGNNYGTSPNGSFNNGNIPPYGPGSQPPFGAPPKKPFNNKKNHSNTGKIVFAVLVCICIVISSIAIGISVKSDGGSSSKPETVTASENNAQKSNPNSNDSADPDVEQSPNTLSSYSGSGSMTPAQIYSAVKESNVAVIVYSNNEKAGEGSGIIAAVDTTGTYTYIITCAHVISTNGLSVQVMLSDKTELDAEIVGYDTKTDVGVLRVKKTGLTCAKFGDSDALTVGQSVYAIGNPGGSEFFGSFTEGMVSALDRPVATSSSSYDLPCIQHSAAINPGNSGGALVNEYGQIIGLNSSKIADTDYEDMGFAVPSNTVISIYKELVKNGYVSNRPMLGITYAAVSSDYTYSAIAWKNDLPYGSIVIASITEGSKLSSSDVKVGDIITSVNGKDLETTDVLLEVIEKSKVGDTLTLGVCRLNSNGSVNSTFTAKVKLVEDKGNNTVENSKETTTDAFSSYFPFGY